MTGQDLYSQLHEARTCAHAAVGQIEPTARAKAEAEVAYWSALERKMTGLRASGCAASLVKDMARGDAEVARLWVRFCSAEAIHRATLEEVMLRKKDIDVLNGMAAREWSVQ